MNIKYIYNMFRNAFTHFNFFAIRLPINGVVFSFCVGGIISASEADVVRLCVQGEGQSEMRLPRDVEERAEKDHQGNAAL